MNRKDIKLMIREAMIGKVPPTPVNVAKAAIRDIFYQMYSRTVREDCWDGLLGQVEGIVGKEATNEAVEQLKNEGLLWKEDVRWHWIKAFSPVNSKVPPKHIPAYINESKRSTKVNDYGCLMLFFKIANWKKIISTVKEKDLYYGDKGDLGREEEPHVTILYGFLPDTDIDEVAKLVKQLPPIKVAVFGISHFENADFDVVKFNVKSAILPKLNKLFSKFPHQKTHNEYSPHVTIAYVKKGAGKKYDKMLKIPAVLTANVAKYSFPNGKRLSWKLTKPQQKT